MSEPTPRETSPRPKRRGGLPLWAWGAIAAAAVVGVVIWRKNSAASSAAPQSDVGAAETVTPVPTGTGLTGSQYGALASQNAAIYEAILDLQGDKSEPKEDHDADDKARQRTGEDHDRDDRSSGTSTPAERPVAHGGTGTMRLPGGRIVPEDRTAGRTPSRTGSRPPVQRRR